MVPAPNQQAPRSVYFHMPWWSVEQRASADRKWSGQAERPDFASARDWENYQRAWKSVHRRHATPAELVVAPEAAPASSASAAQGDA